MRDFYRNLFLALSILVTGFLASCAIPQNLSKMGVTPPLPITFPKGSTQTTLSGSADSGPGSYSLPGVAGQPLALHVDPTAQDATLSITDPNGNVLASNVRQWSGRLPVSGLYRITITAGKSSGMANGVSGKYKVMVDLQKVVNDGMGVDAGK